MMVGEFLMEFGCPAGRDGLWRPPPIATVARSAGF